MKESVEFERKKQHTIGFPTFKLISFSVLIILDDFGKWLLGYMIEFSCLFIPQGYYFTLSLWSTDEYVNYDFERKSIFKI